MTDYHTFCAAMTHHGGRLIAGAARYQAYSVATECGGFHGKRTLDDIRKDARECAEAVIAALDEYENTIELEAAA